MAEVVHITNGGIAAELIRRADLGGEIVPWDDALHEGPVPAGLSLDELSRARARHLAGRPWIDISDVASRFAARDGVLRRARGTDEIVLWFEHDLDDQLQLLQLLHWFEMRRGYAGRLSLICIGSHQEVDRFTGLGQLTPAQIADLLPLRHEVTAAELELGRIGWEAFTSSRPMRLQELVEDELPALPFLRAALWRHLEQFPSTRDGLGRSERQILDAVAAGPLPIGVAFVRSQVEAEARPFMGERSYLEHVAALQAGPRPLVQVDDPRGLAPAPECGIDEDYWHRPLALTDAGAEVRGGADRSRLQTVDRWHGGVRVHGEPLPWRFNPVSRRIQQPV